MFILLHIIIFLIVRYLHSTERVLMFLFHINLTGKIRCHRRFCIHIILCKTTPIKILFNTTVVNFTETIILKMQLH